MRIFVSGGCGFLGSAITEEFLKDHEVTVYDNLMYRQASLLHLCVNKRFNFIHGDVRDQPRLAEVIRNHDVIIPLAAIVGQPACDANKQLAKDVNYEQIKFIMSVKSRDQLVILPNTNSSYGSSVEICTEESPTNPLSWYAQTKCEAEKCVLEGFGISLRLATLFGITSRPRLDLLVNDFVYKALTDGYIVLFEKHFQRNYIHVRDVVSAFALMIDNYDKCQGNVYNVGLSSANLTKYELAMKIKEHIPGFSIQYDEFKTDKDKRSYLVSNLKLESLGWKPQYTLDDGIEELKKAFSMLFCRQQEFTNL